MTEEVKSYRIAKVASELGVGVQTIAEELNKRGFDVDAKPTSKLNDEMYMVLLKVFKSDKEAREEAIQLEKNKKDLVEVAKGAKPAKENTENEDEEDLVIINNPTLVLPTEKPAVEIKPEPPVAEPPAIVAEEKTVPPVVEPAPEKVEPVVPATERKVTLAGPKIVNKINLDDLSGKGKRDKDKPKAEEKPIEQPKPIEVPEAKVEPVEKTVVPEVKEEVKQVVVEEKKPEPTPEPEPEIITPEPTPVAETVIETKEPEVEATKEPETPLTPETPAEPVADVPKDNIIRPKMEKLQGLTVLGKIKLPVDEPKKKPVASSDPNEKTKKKRKRKVSTVISSDNPNIAKQFNKEKEKEKRDGTGPKPPSTTTGGGTGGGDNRRGRFDRNEPREISQKEIQDKLKQTMAKLNPGSKGPGNNSSQRYKNRRSKRDQHAQNREDAMMELEAEKNILRVTEFVTANELAKLMNISVNQVITTCFSLGMMVSINQRLDAETITIVADEFGFDVQFVGADLQDTIEEEEDKPEDLVPRPPIVTVMGHVDHGKTSLLDYIRDANIVAGEAGGITQHIGAYEVTLKDGRQITFLDTPGHEAFTAMRARGAKLTDISIIVIAADDSVMPQTKEAISHSQAANVPMVFAFNKMDRDGANADKVREQLSAMNILVEEWGGKYQTQEISAKKGLNIDSLLEKVLLEAEILDLKANPNKRAKGTVIEARMDKGRGIVATLMVQEGTLKIGDPLVAGAIFGRVKAMFNERGQKVEIAGPSVPVSVLGFTSTPQAGENFNVMATEAEAKDITTKRTQLLREQGLRTKKHITLDEIGRRLAIGNFKELNVIVKADVDGSAEALADSLLKLSTPEVQVNVIHKGVGQISESDVLLATASDAIVVGFQVRPSAQAKRLAEQEDIEIKLYSIIYSVIDEIKAAIEGLLEPKMEEKIICNVEVREVFKISKVGTIAGCMVTDGKIHRNTRIRIIRDGVVVHTGTIDTLKRYKDDVKEVATGYECGISIKNFNDIREGDNIEGFEEVEVKRKL